MQTLAQKPVQQPHQNIWTELHTTPAPGRSDMLPPPPGYHRMQVGITGNTIKDETQNEYYSRMYSSYS